jgi:predicted enzyme related to lactoylglutathione lyase
MSTSSDRGLFVWHEVGTNDLRAGEEFYAKVAGWKSESWSQNPSYKLFVTRRESRAGLYLITEVPNMVTPPPHWLSYVGTPDVDATVRQAVELGGKVVVPGYNVPHVGRMAHLQDPQGALFAVSSQEQRSRYKEPQLGDFSWHELLTSNWQTAFDFYAKLFGWEKMEAMDMGPQGTYQIFGTGGIQLGGMFSPGGLPPGGPLWIPYFLTADARRTAEIAKDNGAMIVHGPMEVTGGDWVFTGIDPQNAMFAAHSKKKVATPTTKSEAAKGAKPAKSSKKTSAKKTTKTVKAKATKTTKATKGTKAAKGSARLQASRKESKKRR